MDRTEIVLVSMPFGPFWIPTAGIGVLTGAAKQAGFSVRATYSSIRLGQKIGPVLYNFISENYLARQVLLSEWLFAWDIRIPSAEAMQQYDRYYQQEYQHFLKLFLTDGSTVPRFDLLQLRTLCQEFLTAEAQRIVAMHPRIVGCSSTFFQHTASLALLKQIKALHPEIITMLGGANCEADMGCETARQFPWVDFVFSGEADETFPQVCQTIFANGCAIGIDDIPYGVYTHAKANLHPLVSGTHNGYETALVHDLAQACMPNYDQYFEELEQTGMVNKDYRVCAVESARGCQKGERSLCNFCGLNGARVCYRTKSPEQFIAEIHTLSNHYDAHVFVLTDNILGNQAFTTWLKHAAAEKQWTFFLEVRSILTEPQIRQLADAEVFNVQPGIESLNDHLLRLMNKGNSAIANIAMMKYVREYSIKISWNLLYDIPGEQEEDYLHIAELIPLLHHLQPPLTTPVSFCKFSQYHTTPEKYGLQLIPLPAYKMIYPELSDEALAKLAYHFVDQNAVTSANDGLSEAKQLLFKRVGEWRSLHNFPPGVDLQRIAQYLPTLTITEVNGLLKIRDNRRCAVSSHFFLDELESELYRQTRAPRTLAHIAAQIEQQPHLKSGVDEIEQRLQTLVNNKLLIKIGKHYLSLAIYQRKMASATQKYGYNYLHQRGKLIYYNKNHD